MTGSEMIALAQIFASLVTAVVGIFVGAALKTKIDLPTYQAKVRELHDHINALAVEVAVLKDREARK